MLHEINNNFDIKANKPLDARWGAWTSVEQANERVLRYQRHKGLICGVLVDGVITRHWWYEGVEDEHLVVMLTGEGGGGTGEDGRTVEMQTNDTHIQWRWYEQSPPDTWKDLIAIDAITGGDGREVEMRFGPNSYIQWRYALQAPADIWKDLVSVADIKGSEGEQGIQGVQGEQGIQGEKGEQGERGEKGDKGNPGERGDTGDPGNDGTSVVILGTLLFEHELPETGNAGDGWLIDGYLWVWNEEWTNVGYLQGPKGDKGERGDTGDEGMQGEKGNPGDEGVQGIQGIQGVQGIQGEKGNQGDKGLKGDDGWGIASIVLHAVDGKKKTYRITYSDGATQDFDLYDGNDGREVELRVGDQILSTEQYIQWRYVGDQNWIDLVKLDDIRGDDGAQGVNAYVYIAYAADDNGSGFSNTFNPDLDYIAVLSTNSEITSPSASDFTGLWKNTRGTGSSLWQDQDYLYNGTITPGTEGSTVGYFEGAMGSISPVNTILLLWHNLGYIYLSFIQSPDNVPYGQQDMQVTVGGNTYTLAYVTENQWRVFTANPFTDGVPLNVSIRHLDKIEPRQGKKADVQDVEGAVNTKRVIATQHSLQGGGNLSANLILSLVGDKPNPGANQYYGTNESSAKGYYPLPEQVQSDWTETDTENLAYIKNKPFVIEDIAFDFNDIEEGVPQTYVLDVKASYDYEILAAVLESDGDLDGVSIKIDGVNVTGLGAIDVTPTTTETAATDDNEVAENARVTLHTTDQFANIPTYIRGKIKTRRL